MCVSYIRGVSESSAMATQLGIMSPVFCSPDNVTGVQIKDVVAKRLRDYPEQRHLAAVVIVYEAFTAAFPCE